MRRNSIITNQLIQVWDKGKSCELDTLTDISIKIYRCTLCSFSFIYQCLFKVIMHLCIIVLHIETCQSHNWDPWLTMLLSKHIKDFSTAQKYYCINVLAPFTALLLLTFNTSICIFSNFVKVLLRLRCIFLDAAFLMFCMPFSTYLRYDFDLF